MTAHKTSDMRSGRVSRNFEARRKGETTAYERSYEKETKVAILHPFILFNKDKKYYFEIWFLWWSSLDHSNIGIQLWRLIFYNIFFQKENYSNHCFKQILPLAPHPLIVHTKKIKRPTLGLLFSLKLWWLLLGREQYDFHSRVCILVSRIFAPSGLSCMFFPINTVVVKMFIGWTLLHHLL